MKLEAAYGHTVIRKENGCNKGEVVSEGKNKGKIVHFEDGVGHVITINNKIGGEQNLLVLNDHWILAIEEIEDND